MRYDDIVERDRGFLTQHDREYLIGRLEEMSDNTEQQKRFQVRERFRHAMFDFYFVTEHLSIRDKRLLWPEIDNWLHRAQNRRQQLDDFDYPEAPFLAKCWRDIISLFVECHIQAGIPEAELLAEWVIEQGINKGVRRKAMQEYQAYREVDAAIDWGVGDSIKLQNYFNRISQNIPKEENEADDYLRELWRNGYLLDTHRAHLYNTHVRD